MGNDVRIKIQADVDEANANLTKFAGEFKKLSSELQKPIGQIQSFVTLKRGLTDSETAFKTAQDKVSALAKEIRASEAPPERLSKAFEKAKKEASNLKDVLEKQRVELQNARQAMTASGIDVTKLASEQVRLKKAIHDTTEEWKQNKAIASARDTLGLKSHQDIRAEIERLKTSYKTLATSGKLSMSELAQAKVVLNQRIRELKDQTSAWAGGLEKVKGAIAGFAVGAATFLLPIKEAMQFETAMTNVAKVVDAPQKDIDALGQKLQDLTRTLPLTAVELARIAEAGGQMGIAAGDIQSFVVATAKIATAFKISAEDAGTAIGKLKNLYRLTIPDIEKLADAVNVLGNNTNAVERDILQVLVEVGGMSQIFGLTGRQTAALASAFLSLGVPVNMVDTSISAMLSKLQAANVATPEFKEALNSLGISADQLAKDIAEKPQEALLNFLETLKKLDNKDLSEKLVKLFGLEYQKNIATLIKGLDEYKRALGLAQNETGTAGAVNKEFARGLDTLENQMKLAGNSVKELANRLALLDAAKAVVKGFTSLVNGITDFAKAAPLLAQLTTGAVAAVSSFGAFKLAGEGLSILFGKTADSAGALISKITGASKTVAGLGEASTGAVAGVSRLSGSLLLAFSALAADRLYAIYQEYKKFLGIQTDIEKISEAYKKSASAFEAYKDVQLKGLNELKLMSDEQLRNEYSNLQKALSYWVRYKAGLETKAAENTTAGFIFTSPIPTEEAKKAQAELPEVESAIDKLMEAYQRLGIAARANNVDLTEFTNVVSEAGKGAAAGTTGAKQLVITLEKASEASKELARQHDLMASSLSRSYDFAAERAKALATDEREGARLSLEIERQKKDTLIGLANEVYWKRLSSIQQSVGEEKAKTEEIKTITKDMTTAKIKAIEEWLGKLQSAHLQAVADEKKYADEVKALRRELANQQRTTEEMIREAKRKTMTEEQVWYDKRKEAEQTLREALKAISQAGTAKELEEAQKIAEKARQQFSGLTGEVKNGDQVVISMQKSVDAATKGMMSAQGAIKEAITKQTELAEKNRKNSEDNAANFKRQWEENKNLLDELNNMEVSPTAKIQVDSTDVDAKLAELDGKTTTSTHIIYEQTVQQSATGGPVRFASGGWNRLRGKLAGYGGGDRIRALLEAGEFIIRKEAVSKYGAGLFHALNSMRLNLSDMLTSVTPQAPVGARMAYSTGGAVEDYGTLRLQAGDMELPVRMASGPKGRELLRQFEAQLKKERLVKGR